LAHDGANRHDSKLLEPTIDSIPIERPEPTPEQPQGCAWTGYDFDSVRETANKHGFTPHVRSRGEELVLKARTPGWRARRWVVEARHFWMSRLAGPQRSSPSTYRGAVGRRKLDQGVAGSHLS
jgi:putative transposase